MRSKIASTYLWLLLAALSFGQSKSGEVPSSAVLYFSTINVGGGIVTYQRVKAPTPDPMQEGARAPGTATEGAPFEAVSVMPLSLSCTVYGNELTELRWWYDGMEYRARSSINFHQLRSVGSFEFEGRPYNLVLGIGDEPLEKLDPAFSLPQFQATRASRPESWYELISSASADIPEAVLKGLSDLHHYYDAHKEALIARWQEDSALAAQPKEPKAAPVETVIRFWPIKSRTHLQKSGEERR